MSKRALVIGADGVIGSSLYKRLKVDGWYVVGTTHKLDSISRGFIFFDLDETIADRFISPEVNVAFICAGVTSLAQCRADFEGTSKVNVTSTVNLVNKLHELDIFTIFISTNLVFDGKIHFCPASHAKNPIEPYGVQKSIVEDEVLALGGNAAILRLSKVVHPNFPLFIEWYHDLINGYQISPYMDMNFSPVSVESVIDLLVSIASSKSEGVFQLSSNGDISYVAAAKLLAKCLGLDEDVVVPTKKDLLEDGVLCSINTTLDSKRVSSEFNAHPKSPDFVLSDLYFNMFGCGIK